MLLRSYVVTEPIVFWQMEHPFYYYLFNNYVVVTDVIVTRPDVIKTHIICFCIVVHDVIMEPCGCRGHHSPNVMGCCLSLSL